MMKITVGGQAASGKTTLARILSEKLSFTHISAGVLMRQMAKEQGMALEDFSEYAKTHPEIDKQIDERQKKLSLAGDCVVDGRLSRFFLEPDLSIWLMAPSEVRASRVLGRGEDFKDLATAKAAIDERDQSELSRYMEFYDIDLSDISVYDLVINTSRFNIEQMSRVALESVNSLRR